MNDGRENLTALTIDLCTIPSTSLGITTYHAIAFARADQT
jgi:hypothetical protein